MQMTDALARIQHNNTLKIIMTLVQHKQHVQFLTSAPNFRGSADPAFRGPCNSDQISHSRFTWTVLLWRKLFLFFLYLLGSLLN